MSTRTHSWFPLVLLPLLLVPSLNASVLIDDFSVASVEISSAGSPGPAATTQTLSILGQNATRTFTVIAAAGISQGQITGGTLGFVSEPAGGGQTTLEYEDFSGDLSSTPFLRLDFESINYSGSMEIGLISTSNPQILGMVLSPPTSGGPTSQFIDVRGFNGYQDGFLDGVSAVTLALVGTDGPFFGVRISKISFTDELEYRAAIPEPDAVTCVAGVLLAGFALAHRARIRSPGCARD